MRITIVLAVLAFSTIFLGFCGSAAYAQEVRLPQADLDTTLEHLGSIDESGAFDIGESLLHPATPLYFLKAIRERLELALAKTSDAKLQRHLEFSQRRLREVKSLVKAKRQDLIPPVLERYKDSLGQANINLTTGQAVARHLYVLQRVYEQVDNKAAKRAIRAAIERGQEHISSLLQRIGESDRRGFAKRAAVRHAHACRFMAREATSSALTEVERSVVSKKAADCKENVRKYFRSELEEFIRQRP